MRASDALRCRSTCKQPRSVWILKNVFQVHGIDAAEKVTVIKQLRRGQVAESGAAIRARTRAVARNRRRPRSTDRSSPWIRSSSRTHQSTEKQPRAQLPEGQRDGQMVVLPPPVSANLGLHHDADAESGLRLRWPSIRCSAR